MPQKFLNADVIGEIIQFASSSANEALVYAKVSSNWHSAFLDCESLWIQLVRFRWPQSRLKACTMPVYRARALSDRGLAPILSTSLHEIENCNWDFRCPMFAEALTGTDEVDKVSGMPILFCQVCQQNVYTVTNDAQLKQRIAERRCVRFNKKLIHTKVGGSILIAVLFPEDSPDAGQKFLRGLQRLNCVEEDSTSVTSKPFYRYREDQFGLTLDFVPVTVSKDGCKLTIPKPFDESEHRFSYFVTLYGVDGKALREQISLNKGKTKGAKDHPLEVAMEACASCDFGQVELRTKKCDVVQSLKELSVAQAMIIDWFSPEEKMGEMEFTPD